MIDGRHTSEIKVLVVEELYADEYASMVRLACLIVGDESASHDIVQDAFAELIHRMPTVRNPGGYLRQIVVNKCRGHIRRQRVEFRYLRRIPPPRYVAEPDVPVFDALRGLPPRQRSAVVMRYYLDATDEQIAETLRVRQATVRSLVRRGLGQLRTDLNHGE